MIERKRGHIVAVSSMTAKVTNFNSVAYITTKFANSGFMRALYDDLCLEGHDEYIKLTTVYPAFFGTQPKMVELLHTLCAEMPVYEPSHAGDLIVEGMLANRREFVIPKESAALMLFK